jgi:hypothetical protein
MANRAAPPPWAVIDREHPLARGLAVAFRAGGQVQRCQEHGLPVLTNSGSTAAVGYTHGLPCLVTPGSGLRTGNLQSDPPLVSGFFFAATPTPANLTFPPLFSRGGIDNYVRYSNNVYRVQGIYAGGTRTLEHPVPTPVDTPVSLAFSWDRSSVTNIAKMMTNGVVRDATVIVPSSGAPNSMANSPYVIGSDNAGASPWQGQIFAALVWERLLTDAEMSALHVDPYQLWWWEGKGPAYFT